MPDETEPTCDLLVFDLDGTLIDSQQDLANAVNASLAFVGRPQLELRQIATFIGDGAAMLMNRALDATGGANAPVHAAAMPFFLEYYREHKLDFTYVYPGVHAALQRIREAIPDLPMAVLTNKPVGPSRAICDGLGLSDFFFQNYGGNSFDTKKPDPAGLLALMDEASALVGRRVRPERTIMIGDSRVDVETARAAGTLCIGCSYGLDPERLLAAHSDATVEHPDQWLRTIRDLL